MSKTIKFATSRSKSKHTHYLPTTSIMTSDFRQIRPTNILPLIPEDEVTVDYKQFTRLAPLAVPTFGSFDVRTYAFFVPFTTIWRNFESYISNSLDASLNIQPPIFSLANFLSRLFGITFSGGYGDLSSTSIYREDEIEIQETIDGGFQPVRDFLIQNSEGGSIIGFNLTSKGRFVLQVLEGLGYQIPRFLSVNFYQDNLQSFNQMLQIPYSLLPLLAYFRVLFDYVYPSQYVQQLGIERYFDGTYFTSTQSDSSNYLLELFDLLVVPYDDDFFTSLFPTPNSSNGSVGNNTVVNNSDVTPNGSAQVSLTAFTNERFVGLNQLNNTNQLTLSNYALRWLQSASDYVLRNNIGGTRFHEWMKSHFGFVTKEQDKFRSQWLRTWSDNVQTSDVLATTGTDSQLLGEQAGRGFSTGSGTLRFTAKEHGFFLCLSMLVPKMGYVQGVKPWCHRITSPLDFYTPEFEDQGFEAVPYMDVFSQYGVRSFDGTLPLLVDANAVGKHFQPFGYCSRYTNMYRRSGDYLTGDFTLNSRNANLGAYHTFRDISTISQRNQLANDLNFRVVDSDFDRVFAAAPKDSDGQQYSDKFFSIFYFDVKKRSFIVSSSEALPLFDKSGADVKMPMFGTTI